MIQVSVAALAVLLLSPSGPPPVPAGGPPASGSDGLVEIGSAVAVRELVDGVFLHVSTNADGIPSNGMLLRAGDGLLLVDTAWTPEQTEALLAWAAERGTPVRDAIVTHSHDDRMGGLSALQARGIRGRALDVTVGKARGAGGSVPETLLTASDGEIGGPAGSIVLYPGAGHTIDNIVVYVPSARVLFGGCLVKSEKARDMGFVGEADLAAWPETIRRVQARFPDLRTVIPGHGAVSGPAALTRTLDLLAEARTSGNAAPDLPLDLDALYRRLGATGSALVFEEPSGRRFSYGGDRLRHRHLPASTFKIPNSLIALETGVVPGVDTVIPWDKVDRGSPGWNRDHDMRSAFEVSAVWFYQEMARRIGEERMQDYVQRLGYGNRDIGGGLDRFWLSGELRISPEEQVAFLRRLARRELPVSRATMDAVVAIMRQERQDGVSVFSKTGWTHALGPHQGWNVGWAERAGQRWFFAVQVESPNEEFDMRSARIELTNAVLRQAGALPEDAAVAH